MSTNPSSHHLPALVTVQTLCLTDSRLTIHRGLVLPTLPRRRLPRGGRWTTSSDANAARSIALFMKSHFCIILARLCPIRGRKRPDGMAGSFTRLEAVALLDTGRV